MLFINLLAALNFANVYLKKFKKRLKNKKNVYKRKNVTKIKNVKKRFYMYAKCSYEKFSEFG